MIIIIMWVSERNTKKKKKMFEEKISELETVFSIPKYPKTKISEKNMIINSVQIT